MSGQGANQTRTEVISKLNAIERGPNRTAYSSKDPNPSNECMSAKVPTGQAGK